FEVAAIGYRNGGRDGATQQDKRDYCKKSDVGHGGQNYLHDNVPPCDFWEGLGERKSFGSGSLAG
ncbi:hypothetical protein ACSYAD_33890, partial [Acaryochloris marina NIES-2412]|uniref:hypothetical protein n=1 Tax=Acaryochloris marina TaxID=155978 RepID=UPI0040590449